MLFGGGSVLGGLVIAVWGGFRNRVLTLAATSVLFGLLTFAMGFASWFWFFLMLLFLTGLLMPFFGSSSMVLLQERVEQDIQGRVFSFVNLVMVASMPLGTFLFGPLADIMKIEWLMIGTGALMTALGVWVWFDKHLQTVHSQSTPHDERGAT
jgi:DHA3 family macrolide efflux protein-like MFS transporter